jgi:hypothetical protein
MKVLVLGILLAIILGWSFAATPDAGAYDEGGAINYSWLLQVFGGSYGPMAALGAAVVLVGILQLVNRSSGSTVFTRQEMAVLLIIVMIATGGINSAALYGLHLDEYWTPYWWIWMEEEKQAIFLDVFGGTSWCPGEFQTEEFALAVAQGSLGAGNAIAPRFDLLAPLTGTYLLWGLAYAIIGISIALMFRRAYIDIEGIEFPFGEACLVGLEQVESWIGGSRVQRAGMEVVKSKWFIIGICSTIWYLIFFLPGSLQWLASPNKEVFMGWDSGFNWGGLPRKLDIWNPPPAWEFDISKAWGLAFLPYVPLAIWYEPMVYGTFYLMPMDILIGLTVGLVIWQVIYPIAITQAGLMRPWTGYRMSAVFRSVQTADVGGVPSDFLTWIAFGMSAVFIVQPIWRYRSNIIPIFKSIIGTKVGTSVDPKPPMRYTYVMWMFVAGLVLLFGVVFAGMIGVDSYVMTNFMGPLFLYQILQAFGSARLITAGGSYFNLVYSMSDLDPSQIPGTYAFPRSLGYFLGHLRDTNYGGGPLVAVPGVVHGATFGQLSGMTGVASEKVFLLIMSVAIALMAFYIARRVKLANKDVLLTLLIFYPFTLIVTHLFKTVMMFWTDVTKPGIAAFAGTSWVHTIWTTGDEIPARSLDPATWGTLNTVWIAGFAIGFITLSAIYVLRSRLSWFRVGPAGFYISAIFPGILQPVVIALLLKQLTVKVGGARAYQNKGKPTAVGAIVGFGICWFIAHSIKNLWMWRTALGI